MNVMVIGSGGREHALAWACHRSRLKPQVFCAPGNGGTAALGENVPLNPDLLEETADWVIKNHIDLTVIGPEAPLVAGLADAITRRGGMVFGPSAAAAWIEGSKAYAKVLMREAGIPTADFAVFKSVDQAKDYIAKREAPLVIKACGLAAGKGVIVCGTRDEAINAAEAMLLRKVFGFAGHEILVEERLTGPEMSLLALVDGEDYLLLPPSRDYKRAFDGNQGPNTGGMGAYAPLDDVSDEQVSNIAEQVYPPILRQLAGRGVRYQGCLYAGIMLTDQGPRVLEFNCRFGDPEAQAVLPLLKVDGLELFLAVAEGCLGRFINEQGLEACDWRKLSAGRYAATVVAAANGYPGSYKKGMPIEGLPVETDNLVIFHAGTTHQDRTLVTGGGRVLAVTGIGRDHLEAVQRAYAGVEQVRFEDVFFRRDIGGWIGQ